MIDLYKELQDAVSGTSRLMHGIIEKKPEHKQVEKMKEWLTEIQPYKLECRRLHYELIELLIKRNNYAKIS